MKTTLVPALAGAAMLAVASPAVGQDSGDYSGFKFDLGAGYSRIDISDIADIELDSIVLRGTLHLTDALSIEGEGQFGLRDDQVLGADVTLDRGLGIFARGTANVAPNVGLFGRIGYVDAELELSGPGGSMTISDDGWAGGFGGEVFAVSGAGVRADYTYYEFSDGTEADSFSIAFVYRFQ